MNMPLSLCFVLCIYSSIYRIYVHTNHVWPSRGVAGTSHYAAIQIHSEEGRDDVSEKKTNITYAFYLWTPAYCTHMCALKYSLSLSLTVSFSLPVFSIVGRQMGASVTRKGVFDHTEAWVHYEGYEWWRWGRGGRAGACQICRLLLRLIWRGAQEMIKAQVKSLIELSFRLISLLPLPAKALNPPPCTLRGNVSLPAQPCLIQDDRDRTIQL